MGLHGVVAASFLYASGQTPSGQQKAEHAPFTVSMVNVAAFAAPLAPDQPPPPEPLEKVQPAIKPSPAPLSMPIKKEAVKSKLLPKVESKLVKNEAKKVKHHTDSRFNPETVAAGVNDISHEQTAQAGAVKVADTQGPRALSKIKPHYPARARALGIEGEIKVQYDIDGSGRVINIRVLAAQPRNMFEREVKQVMRKWRFEPIAAKNYVTTIVFKIGEGYASALI